MDVPAVHPLAAERRQQRRVDVQHPQAEVVGDRQQLQPAGEQHVIDAPLAHGVEDARGEVGPRRRPDDPRWDAGLPGAVEGEGVGLAGDHADDFGVERAVGDAVEEILQGRAAAAHQDGEPGA